MGRDQVRRHVLRGYEESSDRERALGTVGNWIHAASYGVFWAFCMWIWDMGKAPYPRLRRSAAGFVVGGIAFGLFDSFGWRAFRFPLILVSLPALIIGLLLGRSARPKPAEESAEGTK